MQEQGQGFQKTMSDPTNGPLEHHVLLAAQTATWGALALFTWFFPVVGFVVLVGLTLFSASYFITAYKMHQAVESYKKEEVKDDSSPYEQPALIYPDGTELGSERARHLRENLPEGEK